MYHYFPYNCSVIIQKTSTMELKDKIFYYRFTDKDGQVAIGQAKISKLTAKVKDIMFNKQTNNLKFARLMELEVVTAPTMETTNEPNELYPTFEDAVNKTNCAIKMAFCCNGTRKYFLENPNDIITESVQNIWDSMPENLNLEEVDTTTSVYYNPCGFMWKMGKAVHASYDGLKYDFLTQQCDFINESDLLLLANFYYSEAVCKEANPIKCYTF